MTKIENLARQMAELKESNNALLRELLRNQREYKANLDRANLQIRVLSEGVLKQKERIEELERELEESDSSRWSGGGAWNGDIP